MNYEWGPIYWIFLHMSTFQYPEKPNNQDKKKYIRLIESFIHNIPCSICRQDISDMISISELEGLLNDKSKLIKYMWDIHNRVNKKLNKKEMSFKRFIYIYKNILEQKSSNNLIQNQFINRIKNYVILILVILVLALLISIYIMKGK